MKTVKERQQAKHKIKGTYPDLVGRDAVVGVVDEQVDADWPALAQLGRRQQTHAAGQLQLAALHGARAQEPVQQVDGQRKHLLLAVLLLRHLMTTVAGVGWFVFLFFIHSFIHSFNLLISTCYHLSTNLLIHLLTE